MTDEEKINYLANLVFISRVDGDLSAVEAKAIEDIRKEIGAESALLEKAVRSVAGGRHSLSPEGRLSDKVRNFEDMIFISLIDGTFSEEEKPEILSFAKSINVTQGQIDEILSEARCRLKTKETPKSCTSCCKEIPAASRFCPFCGSSLPGC